MRLRSSTRKKTSGTEVRRTPDLKLRFVGFTRFVSFNIGHVQLLRFVVVMVRSYSFGHLDSVKGITLIFWSSIVLFLIYFVWFKLLSLIKMSIFDAWMALIGLFLRDYPP